MRKQFLFIFLALIVANKIQAQAKGTKVGYIDMEFILQNVPDYAEAKNQLELKALKWKQEIETKNSAITKLKETLKAEKALLTKELISERESEITFLENEVQDFQQLRFGANGELIKQKSALAKPIQDQVFAAIQDIAEAKKYDFIFDKSSDLTILFAAKRFDISDQVIRSLNRTDKREQLTKKELAAEEAKQNKEDALDENPVLNERQKALDEKKLARDKIIADRLLLQEQKKKETEERRNQVLAEREAKKNGTVVAPSSTQVGTGSEKQKSIEATKTAQAEARQKQLDQKAKTLEERNKVIEERKKVIEEKRAQTLLDREAKKNGTVSESTPKEVVKDNSNVVDPNTATKQTAEELKQKQTAEELKQKQADAKAKTLEERKKVIEDRKKALEEKRKKTLEDREAAKKAAAEKTKENTNNN